MKKNNTGRVISRADFEKKWGIRYTVKHTGKMTDMISLSTSSAENKYCQGHCKVAGSICAKCYAERMRKRYKALDKLLRENFRVLTGQIIPVEEWPALNVRYFRFESFADLNNIIQVRNYFNQCIASPETHFALWTKNPHIIHEALQAGAVKPDNLSIIVSSLFLNTPGNFDKYLYFIDGIFTVYDKEYAAAHNIDINCGARHCLTCAICYHATEYKARTGKVLYINELLK